MTKIAKNDHQKWQNKVVKNDKNGEKLPKTVKQGPKMVKKYQKLPPKFQIFSKNDTKITLQAVIQPNYQGVESRLLGT